MRLPIEITPNPLVMSTVELRFTSAVESSALFPEIYKVFLNELPKFEVSNLPQEIKASNQQFKFAPDYILSNEFYKLSFSNCVLSFDHVSEYRLWNNYFPFIAKCVKDFFKIVKTEHIERVGVRYASVLDKTVGAAQILTSVPKLEGQPYQQKFEHYRTILKADGFSLLLQIFDNAKALRKDQEVSGVYIDIDAFCDEKVPANEESAVLRLIERLHAEQKKLFFGLLKEDYIQTLSPKY